MYRKAYYASALSKPKGSNSVKLPLQHNRQFRSVEGIAPAVSFAELGERDQLRGWHLSPRSASTSSARRKGAQLRHPKEIKLFGSIKKSMTFMVKIPFSS